MMLRYNLIEYSNNYSKTSENLLQCYRDDLSDNMTESESFKFKTKIIGKLLVVDVKIVMSLKHLSIF